MVRPRPKVGGGNDIQVAVAIQIDRVHMPGAFEVALDDVAFDPLARLPAKPANVPYVCEGIGEGIGYDEIVVAVPVQIAHATAFGKAGEVIDDGGDGIGSRCRGERDLAGHGAPGDVGLGRKGAPPVQDWPRSARACEPIRLGVCGSGQRQ